MFQMFDNQGRLLTTSGTAASLFAQYILVSNDANLPNNRRLSVTAADFVLIDNGAGSNINLALATTAVVAGSYGTAATVARFTVDAKGRLTFATNVAIAITASQVTDFSEAVDDRVAALIINTTSIAWAYNDVANTFAASVVPNTTLQKIEVRKNSGAVTGTRKRLNFIEGTGISITITDDGVDDEIDVTIDSAAIPPSDIVLTQHHILVGDAANLAADVAMSGDATIVSSGAITLATVNANVGVFGSASKTVTVTANAKGLITDIAEQNIAITASQVTDFAHDILSVSHSDTLAAAVARGSIIVGNSTPKWARVTVGASGTFVQSDGTDTTFSTVTLPLTTTINRILYSSAANVVGQITTAADAVLVTGATGIPVMSTDLPGTVTIGTAYIYRVGGNDVAIADGGTGQSTAVLGFNALSPVTTRGDIIVRGITDNVRLGLGTVGKILRSDGTDLVYSTATYPDVATGTGTILRADGTNWSATTATYPNTVTINQLMFATATNVFGSSAQLTYASPILLNTLSTNGLVSTNVTNANAGGSATARFSLSNGTNTGSMILHGTGFTTAGLLVAGQARFVADSAAGMLISATNAAGVVAFSIAGTAAANETARVDVNGVHFFQPLMGISYKVQTNGLVGRTTLVLGTKAITITGLTTAHKAWVQLQALGGTIAAQYRAVCTANTLTIDAITAGGIVQTLDTSTLDYICILTT